MLRKFSQGCSRLCGTAGGCNTRSTRSCSWHWRMSYWARGRLPSSRSDGRSSWAEPGRFNRTFTAEGPEMIGLMEALADAVRRGRGPAEAGSPSYLTYLLWETGAWPETASAQSAAAGLAEPLTAREVEILRLVAAGMRNQEIAAHLFISLSTVKRHIANAYGKLSVSHRTEAIARANELNLL